MTNTFFDELTEELHKGVHKKGHPFRYITLATVGHENNASLRTVVLRQVSKELQLTIYTDSRTKKISDIKENNQVCLLLYHPKKLLQLKIEGSAQIVTDHVRLKTYWSGIQPSSRKDYITHNSPGSAIKNPNEVEYLEDTNYFSMIDITPTKMEYLRLQRPNHIRVEFTKEKEDWKGNFLVP